MTTHPHPVNPATLAAARDALDRGEQVTADLQPAAVALALEAQARREADKEPTE